MYCTLDFSTLFLCCMGGGERGPAGSLGLSCTVKNYLGEQDMFFLKLIYLEENDVLRVRIYLIFNYKT